MLMLAGAAEFTGAYLGIGLVGALVVGMLGTYYVAKLIVDGVRKSGAAKLEAQARENQDRLKSLMIQRGMSADEIERVLKAEGVETDFGAADEDVETRIVSILSQNGYEGADIERILIAARDGGKIPAAAGRLVETLAENWAKAADIERVLKTRRRPHPA